MADANSDDLAEFMAITGADEASALAIMGASGWALQPAVDLYFASVVGDDAATAGQSRQSQQAPFSTSAAAAASGAGGAAGESRGIAADEGKAEDDGDNIRAPIPSRVDRLYEDLPPQLNPLYYSRNRGRLQQRTHEAFRNFAEEYTERVHGPDAAGATKGLAKLYKPPLEMLFRGDFEEAKEAAAGQRKWLMVNVQSNTEFASHMLNRDTFANEAVKELVAANFILLQVYDNTTRGSKIKNFYRVTDIPSILIIDPVTGALMQDLKGFVEAERFTEELVKFMDTTPHDTGVAQIASAFHKKKAEQSNRGAEALGNGGGSGSERPLTEDDEIAMAIALSMEGQAREARDPHVGVVEQDDDDDFEDNNVEYPSSQPSTLSHSSSPSLHSGPLEHHPTPSSRGPPAASGQSDQQGLVDQQGPEEQKHAADSQPQRSDGGASVGTAVRQLPSEPDASDPDACSVGVRLPDGRRVQRRFSKHHTLQAVHDYCWTEMDAALRDRPFGLAPMMPGGQFLSDYAQSLEEAGVANSLLVLRWRD